MKRSSARRGWFAAAVACALLVVARTASAHPAGFTSVNRYLGVECDERGIVHIAYLLDFAEFPAYAEIEALDSDHDGTVSPAEQRAYLDRRLPPLLGQWEVEVDGSRAALQVVGSNLEVFPGERGLSTLRVAADIGVAPPATPSATAGEIHVAVRDEAFSDRSGWREMAAEDTVGAAVVSGRSARPAGALAYSSPPLAGPPRVDKADFVFRLRAPTGVVPRSGSPEPPWVVDARLARLSSVMRRARGSWSFSALAMGLAFMLGAAHALSPGHGKVMAAAYLVGRRARPSHAVLFGLTVTIAHTAVVFLVGCLALTVERSIGSDRLLRDLELASAVAILALGVVQLSRRWREAAGSSGEEHTHARVETVVDGKRSLLALGASSGLTPCPSALAVLLTAIAIRRYAFGLVLVLAFSLGIALTLTVTGLFVVTARGWLDSIAGTAPLRRWLPVLSSACVLLIGILLCASALSPAAR